MLVLGLKQHERIHLGDITLTFFWSGGKPKIGIEAPRAVPITRRDGPVFVPKKKHEAKK
jgi:sRNA-binding carbon storage regulator CsrA